MSETKERAEYPLSAAGAQRKARPQRPGPWDANDVFVLAFADALRDILREERRGLA
jgi:hypothetical protein